MTIRPPDEADLSALAQRYGLGLSAADITSFAPSPRACWTRGRPSRSCTNARRRRRRPTARGPARPRRQPARRLVRDDGDPRNRRRPTVRPHGRDQGQHHGRRRAEMNGSETLEGFVPRVTRLLSPACSLPVPRSSARRCVRTSASPAAATRRAPARCGTHGTRPALPAGRRAAVPRSSRPAPSISPSAATRVARCVSPARTAARPGTSRPMASSPTQGRSRSS